MSLTISFAEDIFGRFAKVRVRRRDGHVCWTKKETRRHFRDTELLEALWSCDIVHVKLRNMFTTVFKYQQHTPPDSPVSYRRLEKQLRVPKAAC